MVSLWLMRPALAVFERALELTGASPPRLGSSDDDPLRLTCDTGAFHPDFFDIGVRFVSERLREAMRLAPDQVRFRAVDASACPAPIRAMGYMALELVHTVDPFDHDLSSGDWEHMFEGSMTDWSPAAPMVRRWRLRTPRPDCPVRVRWRNDFTPPAPLFQAPGLPWMLVTGELAERVRAAGMDDVAFDDPTVDHEPEPYVLLEAAGTPASPDHPLSTPLANT